MKDFILTDVFSFRKFKKHMKYMDQAEIRLVSNVLLCTQPQYIISEANTNPKLINKNNVL